MLIDQLIPRDINIGRAFYGTHAIWANVLNYWCKENEDSSAWKGIEFDKLAHCIILIWNNLYQENKVTFKAAYFSAPGIHGHGPAIRKKRHLAPSFAIPTIDQIQKSLMLNHIGNPDVLLFTLQKRKYKNKTIYKVSPGRESTRFTIHLSEKLPPAFNRNDNDYCFNLAKFLSGLNKSEIRSLGTHPTLITTIEAIEYNVYVHFLIRIIHEIKLFKNPKKNSTLRSNGKSSTSDLPSLRYISDEIHRKTALNMSDHIKAYNKLIREESISKEIATVALSIFDAPNIIWNADEILEWKKYNKYFSYICDYIEGIHASYIKANEDADISEIEKLNEKKENKIEDGEEAVDNINRYFQTKLPYIHRDPKKKYDYGFMFSQIIHIFKSLPDYSKLHKNKILERLEKYQI